MTTYYQGRTLQKNLNNFTPDAQIIQLEKDFTEKLTIAKNIFHRIKHYTSELEILVLGVIKVYCGPEFSEKNRIEFLLQNIQNEIRDFDERVKTRDIAINRLPSEPALEEKTFSPRRKFNESLLSSTLSDNNTMLAIRNDVKGLINEYREAVDKLKEENKTIHTIMAEKKSHTTKNGDYLSPRRYDKKQVSISVHQSLQDSDFKKSYEQEEKYLSNKKLHEERHAKYAELDRYIDDLNRKKDENLKRLTTIENRLHTIKKTIPDEDSGALKTSDLSRDDERPPVLRSAKRGAYARENNPNITTISSKTQRSARKVDEENEENINYMNYLQRVENRKPPKRMNVIDDHKTHHNRTGSRYKSPIYSKDKKSKNDSHALEEEINDLNKEISTIKSLLDSAMLQRKYQSN